MRVFLNTADTVTVDDSVAMKVMISIEDGARGDSALSYYGSQNTIKSLLC